MKQLTNYDLCVYFSASRFLHLKQTNMSRPNILFIPRVFDPDQPIESLLEDTTPSPAVHHREFVPAELDDGHEAFSLFGGAVTDTQSIDESTAQQPRPEEPRAVFREYVVDRVDIRSPDALGPDASGGSHNIHLLPRFIDTSKDLVWPASTNLHCWWCVHGFLTRPIPCVISMNGSDGVFRVEKIFCSVNCMKAFAMNRVALKQAELSLISMNNYFFRLCHQKLGIPPVNLSEIKAAPPRESLRIFGGPLTIQAFRANFHTLPSLSVLPVPMISVNQTLEWASGRAEGIHTSAVPAEKKRKRAAAVKDVEIVEPEPVVGTIASEGDSFQSRHALSPPAIVTSTGPFIDHHLKKRMSEATARFQKSRMEQQTSGSSSMLRKAFEEQVKEVSSAQSAVVSDKKEGKKTAAHQQSATQSMSPTKAANQPTLRNFLAMDDD